MAVYRALLVVRDKIAQNQRWTICYFLGSRGIDPKRVALLSLANSRRHTSIRSLSTASASHCGPFSRPNPIFSYKRLNWAASEVRLIELLPQKDPEDNAGDMPIACCIHHFSLEDCPKYLALSYAWGDTRRTELLILNGQTLKITKSLDTAFRQLRRMMQNGDLPSKSRIWIDALSINQEDDVEKSWQVHQMGQIYQNAEYALVWLGSASNSSATAMKALDHIGKVGKGGDIHFNGITLNLFRTLLDTDVSIGSSLISLFRRPWWARIWVVQEFSFAKDVLFVCGDTTVWCQPFSKALDLIKQYKASVAIRGRKKDIYKGDYRRFMAEMSSIHNISRLFQIREKLKMEDKRFSMWELLALKRSGMQASDSRDLIYALTGLSADAASKLLYPDYSRDAKYVYIQTAKALLAERRLRLLWFCSQPRVLRGLPSWVPDWSAPWRNDYRYLSEDSGYGQSGQIFWAAGESRPVISFSGQDAHMLLHMQGHEFDTIDDMQSVFDMSRVLHTSGFYQVHLAISERGRALWELKRKHTTAKGSSYEDVIRTLIADIELSWNLDGTFKHHRASPDLIREIYDTYIVRTTERVLEASSNLPASQLHLLYRHVARRPFITSRGYLGLGPVAMLPGDRVVVLFGAELPLILRRDNEGYYQVIGEAYVHGVMDGEVMTMGFKSKSFDIR
jgi:hypothetical protein